MLPGQPGEPEFEAAYAAILEGMAPQPAPAPQASAEVITLATIKPKSLRAAWKLVMTSTPEWRALEEVSRIKQSGVAERFLSSQVDPKHPTTWGDIPIADVRRRHIKSIITGRADTPHAARHLLVVIRKMVTAALDEEWIENDPTHRFSYRPAYGGWRAWTQEERDKFENRWPIGTTPRLCYALALWLGNRRGDVAALRVDAIKGDHIVIDQGKTGRHLELDILPMLRDVLDKTELKGPTILLTQYGEPFSAKSLTGRMADWTKAAGLPKGCTLHGLRKTLGKMLAEGGATTRQIMDVLGHDDIKHAELYLKAAEQKRLARDGMSKVVTLMGRGGLKVAR